METWWWLLLYFIAVLSVDELTHFIAVHYLGT